MGLQAAMLAIGLALAPEGSGYCIEGARITGYVRGAHSPWTYDGTSIWTEEPIAAASWDIPIGAQVDVEGLGSYRVADRGGGLGGYGWIDIATWSRAEALGITRTARACISTG